MYHTYSTVYTELSIWYVDMKLNNASFIALD